MNEHLIQTPEDVTGAQAERAEAQPQLAYPEQRLDVIGFARKDKKKTIVYFPDPPRIIERDPKQSYREAELTDEDKRIVEEAIGRKPDREYLSIDLELDVVRHGLEYDLIVPETGESIRHRDIREGQEEARDDAD